MEELSKWHKYYREMFWVWQSDFFLKLWGDCLDEYGEEYEDVYKYELEDRREEFASFMCMFNRYDINYNRDAIALKILELFEGLGECLYPNGAYLIADRAIHSVGIDLTFNSVKCPTAKIGDCSNEVKGCRHCKKLIKLDLYFGGTMLMCRLDRTKQINHDDVACKDFS